MNGEEREEEPERIIRRILVGLDASPHSRTALEAAAELAARFEAELHGLFVEDENLLRLAGLPFVEELSSFSAVRRRLELQQVERELRVRGRRLQRTFVAITTHANLRGTFRVTRGAVVRELLTAAAEADVLILGKVGWSPLHGRHLGSTARAAVSGTACLTMILQQRTCPGAPVAVVYDGSAAADRALAVAAALQGEQQTALKVVILSAEGPAASHLREQAATRLRERQVHTRFHFLGEADLPGLAHRLQTEPCGTLVLPAEGSLLREEEVTQLLEETEVPVLLVR